MADTEQRGLAGAVGAWAAAVVVVEVAGIVVVTVRLTVVVGSGAADRLGAPASPGRRTVVVVVSEFAGAMTDDEVTDVACGLAPWVVPLPTGTDDAVPELLALTVVVVAPPATGGPGPEPPMPTTAPPTAPPPSTTAPSRCQIFMVPTVLLRRPARKGRTPLLTRD